MILKPAWPARRGCCRWVEVLCSIRGRAGTWVRRKEHPETRLLEETPRDCHFRQFFFGGVRASTTTARAPAEGSRQLEAAMGSAVEIYFFSWRYFFAVAILSAGVIFPLVSENRCSPWQRNSRRFPCVSGTTLPSERGVARPRKAASRVQIVGKPFSIASLPPLVHDCGRL